MKTKAFQARSLGRLTGKINTWLESEEYEITQISHMVEDDDYEKVYSAIVVYQEKKKQEVESARIKVT